MRRRRISQWLCLNAQMQLSSILKITIKKVCGSSGKVWGVSLQYLCADFPRAPGLPSGRRPWGLARRTSGWACSAGGALAGAAPCRQRTAASGRAGRPRCAQTLAPGRCRHYQLGSSDKRQPSKKKKKMHLHQTQVGQVVKSSIFRLVSVMYSGGWSL